MSTLIYLSVPYTSTNPATREERVLRVRRVMASLIAQGRLVVCPVAMNHEALELLQGNASAQRGSYWRELENRLSAACDELVVLTLPGWETSSGVGREIRLFQVAKKPVTLMSDGEEGLSAAATQLFRE